MKMMKNLACRRWISAHLPLTASVCLLLLAGCNIQQESSLLSSKTSTKDAVTRTLDATPFAFDLAVDTISYNSCVGVNLNQSGIHGIKIGVSEGFVDANGSGAVKGGIKLRSDFLQFIAQNVQPNYPAPTVSSSQIQYILKNSTANADTYIQYAVRTATDLRVVPDTIQPSNTPMMVRDGVYEGVPLAEEPLISQMTKDLKFGPNKTVLSEGARVYNIGTSTAPKALEASFGYSNIIDETFSADAAANDGQGAAEEYSDKVRAKFNTGTYLLTQTFGNPLAADTTGSDSTGLNSPKRKVATDLTKAYGRGYQLSFVTKNAGYSSWRKNVLNTVVERDLETGQQVAGVSWTCENVVIMKTNEFNNKKIDQPACSQLTAADLTNVNVAKRVKNLRRHYSEADWGVGFFYPKNSAYNPATRTAQPLCIVNKQTDCYLPTTGIVVGSPSEDVGVQYDTTQECYLSRAPNMGVTYVGNKVGNDARRLGRCPQFASICIRSSTSY
ncbi:hypothetical protein [Pseudobdellovibrio exovorus]|uniref:Lipoprotein n=1 Tax=Pseudobdellovibrio exovorus JSS TaxID=1184267 RepID=M4V4U9_9BACT|nr:hypothetical protein [Pseudobdellovibrio exovorus]AGH94362.1 hypothetical protein A11Q_142 [Pseudobdellovibrio exovorus JSS]